MSSTKQDETKGLKTMRQPEELNSLQVSKEIRAEFLAVRHVVLSNMSNNIMNKWSA